MARIGAELGSITQIAGPEAGGAIVINGRPGAEPAGGGAAEIYAEKWVKAARTGEGLYVGRSGRGATPLLDRVVDHFPSPNGRTRILIEGAAGSGEQAAEFATRLPRTRVVAIDTSPVATAAIAERATRQVQDFAEGSNITVVEDDVLAHLSRQAPRTVDAYHANSFFHFLAYEERRAQLEAAREAGVPGALVAVSFKAEGDGLLFEPGLEVVGEVPQGILADPGDGIQRLFVTEPAAVEEEFTDAGLQVIDTMRYEIPDYDRPGRPGRFVGVLATTPV